MSAYGLRKPLDARTLRWVIRQLRRNARDNQAQVPEGQYDSFYSGRAGILIAKARCFEGILREITKTKVVKRG